MLIGARSFVEPGGGVQIVDWRNAPVSRLFYRYEEGDAYEERLGDKLVEGEMLARRTVAIVDADLRRVAAPQGTFSRDLRTGAVARGGDAAGAPADRARRQRGGRRPARRGARAGAAAAAAPPAVRGKLGFDETGARRPDRHLPAIAALIDPRQFELITQPSSGLIAIQGSAGSGKTTIGLHRIAYLAFADPRRFRPEKMLVVVYQRALAAYVSRVLPSLDVEGVPVMTFAAWADAARRAAVPDAGGAADRRDAAAGDARQGARRDAADHRRPPGGAGGLVPGAAADASSRARPTRDAVLAFWDGTSGPGRRARDRARAVGARRQRSIPATRNALENTGRTLRARTRDVVGEWAALLTDREALGAGFARHAPGLFSPGQLDDIHRWCVARDRLRTAGRSDDDGETFALDAEDDALLLRIYQRQRGRLPDAARAARAPLAYEHLMVDEVQDFSPLELAVLLDATTAQRSVTLAGDTAQAIAPEHGFSNWAELLDFLGIAHERVEPLRVSYRSTREIVDVAEHVLGPLMGDVRPVAPRAGAPVEAFAVRVGGRVRASSCRTRSRSWSATSPTPRSRCSRATPSRRASTTRRSRSAEVPTLRLVADQDFSFTAGHRRHRRAPDEGPGVRHRHPARRQRRVVPGHRRRAPPAARRDDARRAPALGHVHGAPSPLLPESLR